jgi:hypothetical protein
MGYIGIIVIYDVVVTLTWIMVPASQREKIILYLFAQLELMPWSPRDSSREKSQP